MKAADEIWVITALLHRRHPERKDFAIEEIVEAAQRENLTGEVRPSIYGNVVQHCVANRPASPSRLCYLFESAEGRRQIFRYPYARDFSRSGGRAVPLAKDLPGRYRELLDWYRREYNVLTPQRMKNDTILALSGLGKGLWKDIDPDEYVRQLREGWE